MKRASSNGIRLGHHDKPNVILVGHKVRSGAEKGESVKLMLV